MTGKSDKNTAPENLVLCGANSYEEKYYFNERFGNLPQTVKDELHILCVLFTEEVGGILTLEFSPEGQLLFKTLVDDYDYYYDEIEAGVRISRLRKEKQELLEALELYYKTFFMDGSGSSGGSGQ